MERKIDTALIGLASLGAAIDTFAVDSGKFNLVTALLVIHALARPAARELEQVFA